MQSIPETVGRFESGLASHPGSRILLAEDDPDMRKIVASALREDGHNVVDVADGGEVLMRLGSGFLAGKRHGGYDLLVADVRMPVATGLQVLDAMRRAHWATPAILMSAFPDAELRRRVAAGDAVLFDKPFDIDDLRTAVTHVLRETLPRDEREDREHPILEIVATRESGLDAWAIKWLLQANGIQAFLGGHAVASSPSHTDIYVLQHDAALARAILEAEEDPAKIA